MQNSRPTENIFGNDNNRLCACGCGGSMEGRHKLSIALPGHYPTVRKMRVCNSARLNESLSKNDFEFFLKRNDAFYLQVRALIEKAGSNRGGIDRLSSRFIIYYMRVMHGYQMNNNWSRPLSDWVEVEFGLKLHRRETKSERLERRLADE